MDGIGNRFTGTSYKSVLLSSIKPNAQEEVLIGRKLVSPPLQPPRISKPEPHFFTRLKAEEKKQFSNKHRLRFDYTKNSSAAQSLPLSQKELIAQKDNPDSLLELSKNNIIDHANFRVDLFFYTLTAYYKTGIVPTEGHTYLQHGKGRNTVDHKTITEGCHSSITPSLVDETIYNNEMSIHKQRCILSGTHFMENLNATMELPSFVNDLDDILESSCREKSLKILTDVSLGKLNPIEGLNLFLQSLKMTLEDLKKQAEKETRTPLHHSFLGKKTPGLKLIDLVLYGTLATTFDDKTQKISDEYIQLMLRLTPDEKKLCLDEKQKTVVYLNKFMEIQKEILETKWAPEKTT